MAIRNTKDFGLDEEEKRLHAEQEKLHKKVEESSLHKPSLHKERNLGEDLGKKKPGPKPKFSEKKVQLAFTGVPETIKDTFDSFCSQIQLTDPSHINLGKKDIILLAMKEYGIPIPERYLPKNKPNKVNRVNAANSINIDNKDS